MHSHVLKGQGTERSRGITEHSSASVLVSREVLLEIRFETAFGFCQSDRTQNDMRHVATRHSPPLDPRTPRNKQSESRGITELSSASFHERPGHVPATSGGQKNVRRGRPSISGVAAASTHHGGRGPFGTDPRAQYIRSVQFPLPSCSTSSRSRWYVPLLGW
jgi:hypothetical protein